uniref:Uncharacterized protein n=1 Tax=Anguilla anguilla TaxID=7936 RepID=A0A0E9SIK3_ANGAN
MLGTVQIPFSFYIPSEQYILTMFLEGFVNVTQIYLLAGFRKVIPGTYRELIICT